MLNYRHLLSDYATLKQYNQRFVLVTLIYVEGSTYRKAGARMLIGEDGRMSGLVSGGCLEGGLLLQAKKIFASGASKIIDIDMREEDEDNWGLVLGCAGHVRLHLQLIRVSDTPNVLDFLQAAYTQREPAWLLTEISEGSSPCQWYGKWYGQIDAEGDELNKSGLSSTVGNLPTEFAKQVILEAGQVNSSVMHKPAEHHNLFFVESIRSAFSLLILGAGVDAYPLCRMALTLGWHVQLVDHRASYIQKLANAELGIDQALHIQTQELSTKVDLNKVDAAVVMSHHVQADEVYLGQLLPTNIPFIGLLGPRYRGEELLLRHQSVLSEHQGRIYSPVGLDLGGEGPESIALSIIAQVQAHASGRNGEALSVKAAGENRVEQYSCGL